MPDTEPYAALWNRALWYLGRRDYGTRELRQKLLRPRPDKPLPAEADVDRAIERLLELDLLGDERCAQRLAEALSRKGYGARGIAFELKKRGLQEEIEAPIEDSERLSELLQSKYAARLGDEKGRRAVYNALLRKGFSHADLRQAMKEYMEEIAALVKEGGAQKQAPPAPKGPAGKAKGRAPKAPAGGASLDILVDDDEEL